MWIIRDDSIMQEHKFVQKGSILSRFSYRNDDWSIMTDDEMELIRQAIVEGKYYVDLRGGKN